MAFISILTGFAESGNKSKKVTMTLYWLPFRPFLLGISVSLFYVIFAIMPVGLILGIPFVYAEIMPIVVIITFLGTICYWTPTGYIPRVMSGDSFVIKFA